MEKNVNREVLFEVLVGTSMLAFSVVPLILLMLLFPTPPCWVLFLWLCQLVAGSLGSLAGFLYLEGEHKPFISNKWESTFKIYQWYFIGWAIGLIGFILFTVIGFLPFIILFFALSEFHPFIIFAIQVIWITSLLISLLYFVTK